MQAGYARAIVLPPSGLWGGYWLLFEPGQGGGIGDEDFIHVVTEGQESLGKKAGKEPNKYGDL